MAKEVFVRVFKQYKVIVEDDRIEDIFKGVKSGDITCYDDLDITEDDLEETNWDDFASIDMVRPNTESIIIEINGEHYKSVTVEGRLI